jgi:hypothetical protein
MSKPPNDRLKTSRAPIGDPGRSIVEGLEEPTKIQRKTQNPRSAATSRQDSSSTRTNNSKLVGPSTLPMSEKPNDRPRTSMAPIGDPGRSIVEGLEEPTRMQRKAQIPQSAAMSCQDSSSATRITSSNRGKPSTWPDSIRPNESRVPTHMDPLGNNNRTVLEGMLNKKDMSKVEKAQKAEEERKRQK